MKVLICSCATGYDLPVFKRFFKPFQSLRGHDYRFHLIVDPQFAHTEAFRWVQAHVPYPITYTERRFENKGEIDARRYMALRDHLRALPAQDRPDYVFASDFRDVLFIKDVNIDKPRFIGLFKEDQRLADADVVKLWVQTAYDATEINLHTQQDHPLFCAGNFLGDTDSTLAFLDHWCAEMDRIALQSGKGYYWGITMASLYYLANIRREIANLHIIDNADGRFLTASARGAWSIVAGRVCHAGHRGEYSYVHMTDRFKLWETVMMALRYDLGLLCFAKDKLSTQLQRSPLRRLRLALGTGH